LHRFALHGMSAVSTRLTVTVLKLKGYEGSVHIELNLLLIENSDCSPE